MVWGGDEKPWNLKQGASGSSAGSASAVAAGLVPFAIGTETLGSIVSPSTRNGVTGLRPTFGRVSRHGAMALSWSMDKIGPISRSALDNALVLDVIQGADPKDKSTVAAGFTYQASRKVEDLKIAYIEPYFRGEGAGAQNDLAVLEALRAAGLQLEAVQLDIDIPSRDLILMLYAEGAAAFDALTRSGEDGLLVAQDKRAWPNIFRSARFIPAVEYLQAARVRSLLQEAFHSWMQAYDVVISPSFGGSQLAITNLTGQPALCLPNGFTESGAPTSITFLANLFEEEKLLMLGRFFQEHTDWHNQRPVLFDRDPTPAERVAKRSYYLN
ncbi:amidase [Nitritalea halalkaliphila]|uniref:amidase n=1 Tax=Nitritalea halalkaliphila TaxID=590849 RepID=UPI0002E495F9|nr:amidase [Nitritalea halalkaliphila]